MKAEIVYGPPGTGKTTYLVEKAKHYAKQYGENVLFLSFTKAAAMEAGSRIKSDLVDVRTIHSLGYQAMGAQKVQVVDRKKLLMFGTKVGFPIRSGDLDSEEGIEDGDRLLAIMNLAVAKKEALQRTYMNSDRPVNFDSFKFFVESYIKWKTQFGYIDFNDMLLMFPPDGPVYNSIIIDEAQDLSKLQWGVVEKLVTRCKRCVVAGDDDQAIYEWGGADINGMQKFEEKYSANRVILNQSYRVPQLVHTMSQKLIRRIPHRVPKEYLPTGHTGTITRYGAPELLSFKKDEDTLILYRNHMFRKELESVLIHDCIPYSTDAGFPSLMDNKYGRAIKTYCKLMDGQNVSGPELFQLQSMTSQKVAGLIINRQFEKFPKNWRSAISVPHFWSDYYHHVDMLAKPVVRMSSIHGSKGREADRVVLHTGLTQRTYQGLGDDPDPEIRVFYVAITRTKNRLDIIDGNRGFDI